MFGLGFLEFITQALVFLLVLAVLAWAVGRGIGAGISSTGDAGRRLKKLGRASLRVPEVLKRLKHRRTT